MLSKEEALKQYGKSENPVDKFYYLTHALAELLLKKERRTCTEEEYFEALILCFYFLFKRLEEKSEEQAELMKDLFFTYYEMYYQETSGLQRIVYGSMFDFLEERFEMFESEISKSHDREGYLFPILIYNIWIKPMNVDLVEPSTVMSEIELPNLMKYVVEIITKMGKVNEILRKQIP